MPEPFLLPRWTSRHAETSGDAFGIHYGGGLAALGSSKGICILDLTWPWEFSRVLCLHLRVRAHHHHLLPCFERFRWSVARFVYFRIFVFSIFYIFRSPHILPPYIFHKSTFDYGAHTRSLKSR